MSAWQPIDTAPRDGTAILAIAVGYEWPEVIRWEAYPADIAEELGEDGYWTFAEQLLADVAAPDMTEISHWMPLPEAPTPTNTVESSS